jgi:hypothetical protein
MERKEKKSINYYMRALHRDIGFFVIGLTVIYSLSGILLIYRDTSFFKHEKQIERKLNPGIPESELGMVLHVKDFDVIKTDGDIVYFHNGTYNKTTGVANYKDKILPAFLDKFNNLHKASNRALVHWFTTIFGILLFFLAISSFWMYKPNTRLFRRGFILTGIGLLAAILLLFL